MSLVRILLGLVALASISSQAGATRLWKGGAGVVASTCSAGDFFTAVDGSGNFTCATPAGSGDITAVGDCASGACFSATSGNNSLIFEGATADTFETTLTTIDPTADATVSLPKRTGTLALEKVINLYDYAACDGTDEATEIQAAITAACALGPGGTLYVPADTCAYATTLTLCSGLAIVGSDSTERVAYGTAQPHELSYSGTGSAIDAQSLSGVRLAGLLLRATSGSFAGPLIDADGIDYLTIDRAMLTAATQAGAATCALLSINDSTDVGVRNSAFYRCGYAIYGRALAANYANVVTLSQNAFYQAAVCSVQNPGDAWMVLGNKWQQQGASDDESSMFCHASGVCSEGFKFSGNMIVDQPNGPTVTELDFCGAGFEISGNYIGGNTTQDGIGFSEPCDGCSVQGNWFGFLDAGVAISSTGSSSESLTILGNDYDTVTTEIAGTRPGRSIMQENTGGTVVNELADIWLNADTDASSGAGAVVIGSNAASTSATHQYDFTEAFANFRKGNDARFYETDDGNYVQVSAPTLAADWTMTLPADDGDANDVLCDPAGDGVSDWCAISDAMVPNTITVDLATLATTATTANAGDSATSFFSSGELERTLLPAASADCAASNWAKGVDADFVLDCAQPAFTDISGSATDAQVPNTITLDNITQITTRAHSSLSSLTSGDDHTQYALLAGRSGGQTLIGGTASGNDLTLQSTSNATRGSIFFGSEWEWLDQIPDAADGTTYSGGLWNPTLSITGAAGTTSYSFGLDLNPTVNLDDAAGTSISFMGAMRARGTFTRSGAATYIPAFYLLYADATNTSATDGLGPMGSAIIYDNLMNTYTSTGASTATLGRVSTVWSNHTTQTNGDASTRLDVGSDYGFYWTTHLSETTGILNVTNVIGAKFETPALGGTTPQITTIAAVDIDKMTGATTDAGNIGIRNKSTTVFAPTTTQAIAAVGNTITCDETYKKFTTFTGTNALTSNPSITDGATGQICILQNVDATATDCITLTDSTLGMQLAGNDTLCPNDTITLVYDGTDWVETARSNN